MSVFCDFRTFSGGDRSALLGGGATNAVNNPGEEAIKPFERWIVYCSVSNTLPVPFFLISFYCIGLLVSGPLAHTLFELVTKRFLGKEGAKWKIAQILSTQLITSPIQNASKFRLILLNLHRRPTLRPPPSTGC